MHTHTHTHKKTKLRGEWQRTILHEDFGSPRVAPCDAPSRISSMRAYVKLDS